MVFPLLGMALSVVSSLLAPFSWGGSFLGVGDSTDSLEACGLGAQ